jgi:ATP-dependent DNA helicase RecQ
MSTERYPSRTSQVIVEQLRRGWEKLPEVLQLLGYDALRGGQKPVICNIMAGKDTMCVLPTGAGKTATFVIPTLCLGWKTIVFSPLVALMRDQVQSLQRQRVAAMAISGMQSDAENAYAAEAWAEGKLSFLYVAPERLHNPRFKSIVERVPPDMVVLDEAHTLSQWSDNFRSSYCKVGDFIREKCPRVVAAFTATCNSEIEADIRRVLGITGAEKLVYYPRRDNLQLVSRPFESDNDIVDILRDSISGSAIVYCSTIARVERLGAALGPRLSEEIVIFHGELNDSEKRSNMDLFMSGQVRVVVATNAFGMGIDKSDIRGVIHRDIPGSIEALAQETGRAGRDGKDSLCLTFFSDESVRTQRFFIECGHPTRAEINSVYNTILRATNPDGLAEVTISEIGAKSGIFVRKVPAIMEVLKANRIIERSEPKDKVFKVRARDPLPRDDRFRRWWQVMEELGVYGKSDSFLEVSFNSFIAAVGVGEQTVRSWLAKWQAADWIRYIPPFRGSATRILGDPNAIDFARLEQRANLSYEKLNKVIEYINVTDSKKHEFLEKYFELGNEA